MVYNMCELEGDDVARKQSGHCALESVQCGALARVIKEQVVGSEYHSSVEARYCRLFGRSMALG